MGSSCTLYSAVRALPFVVLAFAAGCWSASQGVSVLDRAPAADALNAAGRPVKVFIDSGLVWDPGRSVVGVSIGPLRSLARFVKSGPDAASPLSGKEPIQQKCKARR